MANEAVGATNHKPVRALGLNTNDGRKNGFTAIAATSSPADPSDDEEES